MCEICDLLKEYDKALEDLKFRIQQNGHALRMGEAAEAASSATSAVNALHRVLNCNARIAAMVEKLRKNSELSFDKDGKPSFH